MTDPIDRAPFYHDGMRELQDRFDGRRVADGLEKHRLHFEFWDSERKLIEEARFFFIATSYRDNVDCSMRSGDPGFVRNVLSALVLSEHLSVVKTIGAVLVILGIVLLAR